MKRLATACLLVTTGCVTETHDVSGRPYEPKPVTKTSEELAMEERVAADFEAWRKATLEGDFEKHFAGMTTGFLSNWLWQRTRDDLDARWRRWHQKLGEDLRPSFTTWVKECDRLQPDRAYAMPDSIARSAWLRECYSDYFRAELENARVHLVGTSISSVSIDGQSATVTCRLQGGRNTEFWAMVVNPATTHWHVDGYVPPRR